MKVKTLFYMYAHCWYLNHNRAYLPMMHFWSTFKVADETGNCAPSSPLLRNTIILPYCTIIMFSPMGKKEYWNLKKYYFSKFAFFSTNIEMPKLAEFSNIHIIPLGCNFYTKVSYDSVLNFQNSLLEFLLFGASEHV